MTGGAHGGRVTAVRADLTTLDVDVVVNAANSSLAHGGGVARALAVAAGPELDRESREWVREHGEVHDGQAAVTTAGRMPATWVVHVVGPIYDAHGGNAVRLGLAVTSALDAARELGAASVALPAISAGIYGYPLDEATEVIASAARGWLANDPGSVREVLLVGYDEQATAAFQAALDA